MCSRDGYVAIGDDHKAHRKTDRLPAATITPIKPFLPPELIIQDELHLITGPLGTVYGAYETIIEDLCSYKKNGKKIKPKYVVSTATIKNAAEQTECLYARKETANSLRMDSRLETVSLSKRFRLIVILSVNMSEFAHLGSP